MADRGDDWLTDGDISHKPTAAADDDDWLHEPTAAADDDGWLQAASEEPQLCTTVAVLYGSPCGRAVPLEEMYWCKDTSMIISEEVKISRIFHAVKYAWPVVLKGQT